MGNLALGQLPALPFVDAKPPILLCSNNSCYLPVTGTKVNAKCVARLTLLRQLVVNLTYVTLFTDPSGR